MARDINFNSQEWNDIIFQGKNKAYGAYEIRQSSSKRHIIAFIAGLLFVTALILIPKLIEKVVPAIRPPVTISDSNVLVDLTSRDKEIEKINEIKEASTPPTPPLKSTMLFTTPEIVPVEEITNDNIMKTQDDMAASKVQISVANIVGTENGIDIAELDLHKVIADDKDDKVFEVVEQQPAFPGGNEALMKYLGDNINYPAVAMETGIKGRVTLKFVVNKNGDISDIQILKGVDVSLDREAVRVVKSMPKWIPGMQNGKAVNVYFTLPVNFVLQ
jgi:protein TonB